MGCNAASVLPVLALSEFLVIYSVLCILFVFSERAPLPNTTVRLPVSTRYYRRFDQPRNDTPLLTLF